MAAKRARTQACSASQARQRLVQARSYLDVATLTADESDPTLEYAGSQRRLQSSPALRRPTRRAV